MNSPIPVHFSSLIPKMLMFIHSCHLLEFAHFQFTLIHGPNTPGSYAILFFTARDFTSTTRQVHNWVLFSLWLSRFILSGTISNCPLLFPSSIVDTFWWGLWWGGALSSSSVESFSYCSCSLGKPRWCGHSPRARHLWVWSQVGLRKHYYKLS